MFNGDGQMFLHNYWRRFVCSYSIEVGHVVIFKYNGQGNFNVKVFGATRSCAIATTTPTKTTRRRQDEDHVAFCYVFIIFLF
jgi:hypothetical protein